MPAYCVLNIESIRLSNYVMHALLNQAAARKQLTLLYYRYTVF